MYTVLAVCRHVSLCMRLPWMTKQGASRKAKCFLRSRESARARMREREEVDKEEEEEEEEDGFEQNLVPGALFGAHGALFRWLPGRRSP